MKKNIWKWVLVIVLVIFADQITKGILLNMITGGTPLYGAAWEIVPVPYLMAHVNNIFNIVFTWNPGASFSMFRTIGDSAPFVISLITGVVIGFITYYLFARSASYERWPLALIVGGALGNLIDRVRFGAVVDFLDFHIGAHHWPAFNIADICIVVGVCLYVLNWYLARRRCINEIKAKGKK